MRLPSPVAEFQHKSLKLPVADFYTIRHTSPFPLFWLLKRLQTNHFLVLCYLLLNKPTQHATSKVYSFVPIQDFNESWTDEKLYKRYGLTKEEISFIESMVRPMGEDNE